MALHNQLASLTVYALNASTGEPLWSSRRNGWFSSPSIDNLKNLVVLGNRDGRVYAFDTKTGWLKWAFITDGSNHLSSPTISANGLIYTGSLNNNLYCISEDTGQKIWSYTTGGAITSSPTVIDEHVIIGSQDGYLYCFGPPFVTHDVSISDAATSSEIHKPGDLLEICYSVRSSGSTLEAITVTCAYNKSNVWASPEYLEPTTINTHVITIEEGNNFNNTYVWNTSDVQPGRYSIIVQAALAPDEVKASNNIFVDGSLLLIMITDLDVNGAIDIVDIAITAKAYGSRIGDDEWNQEADLDSNGVIDILDVATVAQDFGKIYF